MVIVIVVFSSKMAVRLFLPNDHVGFSSLPGEICSLVFSYLHPIDDNLLGFARVCKRWRDIIYNTPLLWRNVVINPSSKPLFYRQDLEHYEQKMAHKVTQILGRFGRFISRLSAKNISEQNFKKAAIFSNLTDLKSLKALKVNLPCEKRLLSALAQSTKLEEFYARGVRLRPRERQLCRIPEEVILEVGETFPNLKKLVISDFYVSFNTITLALTKLSMLEELRVKYRLEGGCYGGMDSAFIRNYRRSEAGKLIASLAKSEHAGKVTSISLEDVLVTGGEIKSFMENFKSLRKFKLETFIEEIPESVDVTIDSPSLEEITIWDISNIKTVNMVIPNAKKLFISDLHLDAVSIYAPNLDNLRLGPLRSFDENLEEFHLETGNLVSLEVTELGQQTSFTMDTFESILCKNPKLKNLNIEAFAHRLCLSPEMCPLLSVLSITGAVDILEASGNHLRRLEVSGDCINPDSPALREVSLSAIDCELVDICRMPNLKTVTLDCPTINLVFLSDCYDDMITTRCSTCIVMCPGTVIHTLSIDNVVLGEIQMKGDNKINRLKIRNCSLRRFVPINFEVRSLEIAKCDKLRNLCLINDYLEEVSITGCDELLSISLNCPALYRLKLGDNRSFPHGGRALHTMMQNIRKNCPRVEIIHQLIQEES